MRYEFESFKPNCRHIGRRFWSAQAPSCLQVPGLAERCPSVMRGDSLFVRPSSSKPGSKEWEGHVMEVQKDQVGFNVDNSEHQQFFFGGFLLIQGFRLSFQTRSHSVRLILHICFGKSGRFDRFCTFGKSFQPDSTDTFGLWGFWATSNFSKFQKGAFEDSGHLKYNTAVHAAFSSSNRFQENKCDPRTSLQGFNFGASGTWSSTAVAIFVGTCGAETFTGLQKSCRFRITFTILVFTCSLL